MLIRLKELRGEKTQEYISAQLGLVRATYRNYEAGIRQPDLDTLVKMAEYFNCSVDYLLGRTDEKNRYSTGEYPELAKLGLDIKKLEALPTDKLVAMINMINTFIN